MFSQSLTPVGDSLIFSFVVAALPIVVVLVSLGVLRRAAWQSSLAGLLVGLVIATTAWKLPTGWHWTASRRAWCSPCGR